MFSECDITIESCDCITPLGNSVETWRSLCVGRGSLRLVPVPDLEGCPALPLSLFENMEPAAPPRWLGRLAALLQPVSGAEWGRVDTPVFISSSNFGVDCLYHHRREGRSDVIPYATPHGSVEAVRQSVGWSRNLSLTSHACVSAHVAILAASAALSAGARKALVVSYDFVSPFVAGGFAALKILNGALPMPFHAGESGAIALGEGAGYAVLTRGGKGLRILDQSLWNEMHHFTANNPDGSGFASVIEPMADHLAHRRVWVKGHGTGTIEAGRLEAETLAKILPGAPLTGWKGAIGHTLGSCGMVELALACRAIEGGRIPGTVGSAAPFFSGSVAPEAFDTAPFDTALLLSNAFGGAHAALALAHD